MWGAYPGTVREAISRVSMLHCLYSELFAFSLWIFRWNTLMQTLPWEVFALLFPVGDQPPLVLLQVRYCSEDFKLILNSIRFQWL